MRTSKRKAILCCVLTCLLGIQAGSAQAYPNFHLGLGLNKDCQLIDQGQVCANGARGEVLLDLFGKTRSEFKSPFSKPEKSRESKKSSGGWSAFGNLSGDGAVIVLGVLLVIMVVAGVVWALAALYSSELTLGIYYSQDAFTSSGKIENPEESESLIERKRYGLQVGMYPVEDWWFRLHIGSGPASSQTRYLKEERISNYQDGRSTKAGIGIVPPPESSGPFVFFEGEYLTIYNRTWRDAINYRGSSGKQYRIGMAVLTGLTLAF